MHPKRKTQKTHWRLVLREENNNGHRLLKSKKITHALNHYRAAHKFKTCCKLKFIITKILALHSCTGEGEGWGRVKGEGKGGLILALHSCVTKTITRDSYLRIAKIQFVRHNTKNIIPKHRKAPRPFWCHVKILPGSFRHIMIGLPF